MKAGRLIEILQGYDHDIEVFVYDWQGGDEVPVGTVIDDSDKLIIDCARLTNEEIERRNAERAKR